MKNAKYNEQVALLLRILPFVAAQEVFALKGGTAINLFVREMPRLSVDIDLTYLPISDRTSSLLEITKRLKNIKSAVESSVPEIKVTLETVKGVNTPTGAIVTSRKAQIKVEVNLVLRGAVYPVEQRQLCKAAQQAYETYVAINCVSFGDLYGGKLCAALDRQHPRDLFDVKVLIENEGITDEVRKAFVVYLASHGRPMNELLSPNWKDIKDTFTTDFLGMTSELVALHDLENIRGLFHQKLIAALTEDEKQFLVSVKEGIPDWQILGIPGLSELPGLLWKVNNIKRMSVEKKTESLKKLKEVLGY